jgi:polyphenol oxidase
MTQPALSWLTPNWTLPDRVRALSTLRLGGVSVAPYASFNLGAHVGDDPLAVAENRHRLREHAQLPAEPDWLEQAHGNAVRDLDADAPRGPADAAITRRPNRLCAILSADCLPVLLAEESGQVVGAAHAGWRGLAAGVIEAAVAAMRVDPERLVAWLGPAIGPAHFEVGAEVREAIARTDAGAAVAFTRSATGRFLADLPQLARRRLTRLGVTRIASANACSYADAEQYFSFRRDGRTGRQATLIWIAE